MVYWGIDKLVNVAHGVTVAEKFYGGMSVATTLVAVWKSIIDPFKVVLQGGNLIFYPSLIIFAAGVVLLAFREQDTIALDARDHRVT